jgi:aspartate kinase
MLTVAKFGGSSLADAGQFRKVARIVRADPSRRIIVVSAPGKRDSGDKKITDLLQLWHRQIANGFQGMSAKLEIIERFTHIVRDLELELDICQELVHIAEAVTRGASEEYSASRGEYLSGKILAELLGYEFVDSASCICFDENGLYRQDDEKIAKAIRDQRAVVTGYYGSTPGGAIRTFSRGGSDLTGAIVARAVRATLYENWTDVSGFRMANPRIVPNPRSIRFITHRELRELSYMGANVFHEEAMFPVQESGIATRILNTNDPADPGTLIVANDDPRRNKSVVTGIAGRTEFTTITIEKALMDKEVGFGRRILSVIENEGVNFEHMPGGVDYLTLIIDDRQLNGKRERIIRKLTEECAPASITVSNLALVVVVGRNMANHKGVLAQIALAIERAGINIRTISQGSNELSIVIGVENDDCDKAVLAIYRAFEK